MIKKFTIYFLLLLICILLNNCTTNDANVFNGEKSKTSSDTKKTQESAPKPQTAKKPESKPEKPPELKITFVELGSVKCIPCKMMQPIMKEIEEEYKNYVKVIFYDVWTKNGRPYAEKYKIRLIPTQVFLDKNGKEYFRHEGFFPKEELVKILEMRGVKK